MKNACEEKAFGVGCTESPGPVSGPLGDRRWAVGHMELLSWALRGAEPVTRRVISLSDSDSCYPPGILFIITTPPGPREPPRGTPSFPST